MALTETPDHTELAAVITFCLDRLHPDLNQVTQNVIRCFLAAPSDSGVQFVCSVPDAFISASVRSFRMPHNASSPFPRLSPSSASSASRSVSGAFILPSMGSSRTPYSTTSSLVRLPLMNPPSASPSVSGISVLASMGSSKTPLNTLSPFFSRFRVELVVGIAVSPTPNPFIQTSVALSSTRCSIPPQLVSTAASGASAVLR
ncbi:hypothetical protein C8F04DRAFT_1177235 [Mycena alexandri]|uniref:Uncharacterized protein n=1 Tax=Mycena alexandri TaxID=1745969 RepID=A0AAD6T8D2_9AGAR|nr:hypothetical protein C8F04DRAFT_1177235 [Mycena alexandri]